MIFFVSTYPFYFLPLQLDILNHNLTSQELKWQKIVKNGYRQESHTWFKKNHTFAVQQHDYKNCGDGLCVVLQCIVILLCPNSMHTKLVMAPAVFFKHVFSTWLQCILSGWAWVVRHSISEAHLQQRTIKKIPPVQIHGRGPLAAWQLPTAGMQPFNICFLQK